MEGKRDKKKLNAIELARVTISKRRDFISDKHEYIIDRYFEKTGERFRCAQLMKLITMG
jgi:hypothetical protein